jgi:hypothetical protein
MKSLDPKSIDRLSKLALLLLFPRADVPLFVVFFRFVVLLLLLQEEREKTSFHPILASSTTTGNTNRSKIYTKKYG